MQEAVPVGEGAMAAVVGLDGAEVARACEQAADGQIVSAANLNSPEQTVIAGHAEAVGRAGALCSQRGAKMVKPLPVSAPFHCRLMRPAQERLAVDIARAAVHDARPPVVTNVDAKIVSDAGEIRDALIRQVTAPVRWVESIHRIASEGVDLLIEVGPGRVLAGLARRIDRHLTVCGVEDPASLDRTVGVLQRTCGET
jgi:[acyl-carrier-protein] S-malonyltransferase